MVPSFHTFATKSNFTPAGIIIPQLILVLVCIPLIIRDAEHLSVVLLTIYLFRLDKGLFGLSLILKLNYCLILSSLNTTSTWLVFFPLNRWSLILLLSVVCFAVTFLINFGH